jgi:ADP-dependent NAD(P)H-hydrate dehydratase / NAD(P)H-hydrate epimerase
MFEPLYTAEEMRGAEELYARYEGLRDELMRRAGGAVAAQARRMFPEAQTFTVVCGPGMNGGDGRIAAAALKAAGREVLIVSSKPEDEEKDLGMPDLIIDALFGTGFAGAPRPPGARLIEQMNGLGRPILSVDIPSGVDASTGEVEGTVVNAAATVTFHRRKVGLAVSPGRFYAGRIVVVDIGISHQAETENALVLKEILELVPRKRVNDDKYSAGSVLVVGGSRGLTGAPCLTAEAAFRADAGYVAVAGPASSVPVFEQRLLEAVKRPLPEDKDGRIVELAVDEIVQQAERARAVAIGPGLGRSDDTKRVVRSLLAKLDQPVVLDADALWELDPFEREAPTVLTPHAGELARLLGEESAWVAAHRLKAVKRAVERFKCVVLLKGAETLVGAPGEGTLVCAGDTPQLATAGTGDVLTGIIGSFLAKGMEARIGAAAAATAHKVAAELAPYRVGLIASDVIAALPRALA